MDKMKKNKNSFWTIFSIVVVIFVLLVASGKIQLDQPTQAEAGEDGCEDACGEGTECKSIKPGPNLKAPERFMCVCIDDDQDDDDDQTTKECSNFLNQDFDDERGKALCEKFSEKYNLTCAYKHGTCTSDSDKFKPRCEKLSTSGLGKEKCESFVWRERGKDNQCKWTKSSCTDKNDGGDKPGGGGGDKPDGNGDDGNGGDGNGDDGDKPDGNDDGNDDGDGNDDDDGNGDDYDPTL